MAFTDIPIEEMAVVITVQLAWIDEHVDRLDRTTHYYSLANQIRVWAAGGARTEEFMTALSLLDFDMPHLRQGRTLEVWIARLQAVRRASLCLSLAELPVGTRLRGLAPIGVRWEAVKTRDGIRPAGNCPASEFVVTHAERGHWWFPCRA